MASDTPANQVLIIDDEFHNILWMADFIEACGHGVIHISNVNDALDYIDKAEYLAVIVDLQIPVIAPFEKAVADRGKIYQRFPGLYVADRARNRGYRARQVIVYSVHKNEEVSKETQRLGIAYIRKRANADMKEYLKMILGTH